MKKTFILLSIFIVVSITACKNNKPQTREAKIEEFRSSLTSEDSTTMLALCDEAMENLKAKNYDKVLASLFEYNDSTHEIKPLSKETETAYKKKFQMFPVLEYERAYFSFMLEGCNDVKYSVTFATAEQTGGTEPAKTAYMFNPVKIDGSWKLCVKTYADEIDRTIY